MASQTLTLSSSFTPKLATFNSPTPTLLPLPPPKFSGSSSLPTPCLKASYGWIRVLHTSHFNHFKCYASPADEKFNIALPVTGASKIGILGGWTPIPDVEHDYEVQALGKFAVQIYNEEAGTDIEFIRVVAAEYQVVAGVNYRLLIEGEEGKAEKSLYKALVFVGLPVSPKTLEYFAKELLK